MKLKYAVFAMLFGFMLVSTLLLFFNDNENNFNEISSIEQQEKAVKFALKPYQTNHDGDF